MEIVQGEEREVHGRAAGHEDHGIVVADPRETPNDVTRLLIDVVVVLAAVGVLEQADAGARELRELLADVIDDLLRHVGGACGEVEDPETRVGRWGAE